MNLKLINILQEIKIQPFGFIKAILDWTHPDGITKAYVFTIGKYKYFFYLYDNDDTVSIRGETRHTKKLQTLINFLNSRNIPSSVDNYGNTSVATKYIRFIE